MVLVVIRGGIRRTCSYFIYSHNLNLQFISNSSHVLQTTYNKLQITKINNDNSNEKSIRDKLVYNSIIKCSNVDYQKKYIKEGKKMKKYYEEGAPVIALKYFTKDFVNGPLEHKQDLVNEEEKIKGTNKQKVNFPFKTYDSVELDQTYCNTVDGGFENALKSDVDTSDINYLQDKSSNWCKPKKSWMKDYNKYTEVSLKEEEGSEDEDECSEINYGTADPNIAASNVPCGGCGAHLHCKDPSIPGYLPKEIFVWQSPAQLQSLVCQRCHFLQQYNTALSVSVDPATYPQLLSQIRTQYALVILVVDMTDFPCSIWPGILDIIGPRRPLFVVGNKVDLLQDWSGGMLRRAKQALEAQLPRKANVLHTALVSAKTGFGVEDLITALYKIWEYRGDVYLVGCTNVGKSMLFNALLQSDYCKSRATDLIQRATTAPWPGTTLNLLKFPITRAEGWRLAMRSLRLKEESTEQLQRIQEGFAPTTPQMITQINRTYTHGNIEQNMDEYGDDPFAVPKMDALRRLRAPGSGVNPSDPMLAQSKWLYDTPGVITSDQIIDLLTTEELMLTLPREPPIPRTFTVWAGQTLMVGGLGRLDYISGAANIKMTVLAAATLPVTICFTVDAEQVYSHYLGSAALAVPCGDGERLRVWPGLSAAEEFSLKGTGWSESCGDIVLSSAGWVAVTAAQDQLLRLRPWTPDARGAHVRVPPVLPRAVGVKGQRMYKSPAYTYFNERVKRLRNR